MENTHGSCPIKDLTEMKTHKVRRLYHSLKSKETELGVTVVDVSRDDPKWEKRLKTILHDPSLCTRCTPFKSVTNL